MMHDGHMGDIGGMMSGLMVGSGWLALLACLVLGGFARVPLRAAGERRAEGQPWAVPGSVGFGLLAVAVLVALGAWGTFFGFMGVAFAAVTALGAWQSFTEGERRRPREAEQVRHAARLGEAFRGGPASARRSGAGPPDRPCRRRRGAPPPTRRPPGTRVTPPGPARAPATAGGGDAEPHTVWRVRGAG
ncbi:hypothetical protein [Micrococcus luteus]|uniref:hypothetical protein n=1 Tax=Micrococcus luteus TaxID=1270 RepID=UPI0021B3C13D|nr:hypothetical protein [Micrococcus luteus]